MGLDDDVFTFIDRADPGTQILGPFLTFLALLCHSLIRCLSGRCRRVSTATFVSMFSGLKELTRLI